MTYWNNLKVTGQPGKRKAPVAGASTNHRGMDVVFPDGKVRPEIGGTVYHSGNMDGYGNIVIIKGDDGNFYHYAHNAANRVKKGQRVKPGEVIATMGNTGTSSGPHTHIEVTNSKGVNLHPQTKQDLGIGGNKLASQGFYGNAITGAAAPIGQTAPIMQPSPSLMNPVGDIARIGAGTTMLNDLVAKQAQEQAREIANRYNIAQMMQNAQANIDAETAANLNAVNTQMDRGMYSPEDIKLANAQANLSNTIGNIQAQDTLNQLQQDYNNRRSAEDMAALIDERNRAMMEQYIASNPVLQQYMQAQQTGQPVGGYQIDPQEFQRAVARDNSINTYLNSVALANAKSNPQLAAMAFNVANNSPSNSAQKMLEMANANYQMQLANQYGVPYQQLMDASKGMGKYLEAYAPNQMSAYNQANQQAEQNLRAGLENIGKNRVKQYENLVAANQNYIQSLEDANKNLIAANKPGAEIIQESNKATNEMLAKHPELAVKKMEMEGGLAKAPIQAQIQGNTAVGTETMEQIGGLAKNINSANTDMYVSDNTRLNALDKLAQQEASGGSNSATQAKLEQADRKAKAQVATNVVKSLMVDTGKEKVLPKTPDTMNNFILQLKMSGMYTNDEIADLVNAYFGDTSSVQQQPAQKQQTNNSISSKLKEAQKNWEAKDKERDKKAQSRNTSQNYAEWALKGILGGPLGW